MSKKKVIAILFSIVLLAVTAAYFIGRYYFSKHYFPNTYINTVDCSDLTDDEAITALGQHLDTYKITIHDAVTDMIVTAEDAGLKYEGTQEVRDLLAKQDIDRWFLELQKEHIFTAMSTSLDEEKLISYLDTLECMQPEKLQKPVNAKIEYNKESKAFEIVDEIIGNVVIADPFYATVKELILQGEASLDLTTNEFYKQPKYKAADELVQNTKATLDQYMSTVIEYTAGDLSYTLDHNDIHTFLKVSKDFKISMDKDKMKTYVGEKISPVFNTVGSTRHIKSPGSGEITISGGAFGWQVGLVGERDQMIQDIKSGKTIEREPVYLQDGKCRKKDDDIGDSYVDVSIAQQTLWVVKDGKVVLTSSVVTGMTAKGRDTDKGVYMIEFKRTNYEMRDYDVTVKYWMPFNTEVGEGFHDATWRSSFGGSIYKNNGSHGCVNLPYEVAKQMYNMLPAGYPVIIH